MIVHIKKLTEEHGKLYIAQYTEPCEKVKALQNLRKTLNRFDISINCDQVMHLSHSIGTELAYMLNITYRGIIVLNGEPITIVSPGIYEVFARDLVHGHHDLSLISL